jgi:membrane-bound lytic murein transglycosylase F
MRDRVFVRRLRSLCRRSLIGLAALSLLAFSGCESTLSPPPHGKPGLTVVVRPGPSTWFTLPNGKTTGFDHDLLTRFARERGVPLNVTFADGAAPLLAQIAHGDAQLGAGGLFQAGFIPGDAREPALAWSTGYHTVEPVLIYNADGYRPRRWSDLDHETVAYPAHTGLDAPLATVRYAHPEVNWQALDVASSDALIAQVADGTISYAVVASSDAAMARNIYLDFDVAFSAGPRREFAWAVAPGYPELRNALDAYFARLRNDGTLARLAERYFGTSADVERVDAGVFQQRIRKTLPEWRKTFVEAQARSGIEWRLLAAVAYQESQWDPVATSETGVRGLMQITEETARHLGIDRLDAKSSAIGAARYLADLKSKLPARIAEPDRTWLALAAFNIGIAHLEDARILAQKQKLNPDLWTDVRKVLPLLAEPEFYVGAKYGYARGGMPVAFVGRVRGYYDILLRTESPGEPRLSTSLASR